MRKLTDHQVNPANDCPTIKVLDEPGNGGACHKYLIRGYEPISNPSYQGERNELSALILFQNGPISEKGIGVNGITHEALLAIVIDRLRDFQKGPYACKANACAITHIEEAMHWLQQRTLERMRRGVEGTHNI